MSDKDLIARLWREAAYVKPLSKGAYEALTDAADAFEAATRERDAALAAIERVREIHVRDTPSIGGDWCLDDHHKWPCPTVAAIDGAPEPEEKP